MAHTIKKQRSINPMWLYEHNFATLEALFPEVIAGEEQNVRRQLAASRLRLSVVERCKYTLTIEIKQHFPQAAIFTRPLSMRVRVYTDARLAEVINYQGKIRFQVKYSVPNKQMYAPDEKYQINHLLYDWLMQISRYLKGLEKVSLCC